jgi:hypothetical protein
VPADRGDHRAAPAPHLALIWRELAHIAHADEPALGRKQEQGLK